MHTRTRERERGMGEENKQMIKQYENLAEVEHYESMNELVESNKDEMNNIVTVNSLFKQRRLSICSNCQNLIWEIKNYKFKEQRMGAESNLDETPVDKDNHAIDALLYLTQAILNRRSVSEFEKAERKSLKVKTVKRENIGIINYG